MARTIIVVSRPPRDPHSFEMAIQPSAGRGRPRSAIRIVGFDPASAAATAVAAAIGREEPCLIMGPADVMALVPDEFKEKK